MDKIEYLNLIQSLDTEHKKQLLCRMIEISYEGKACVMEHTDWEGGYVASFERKQRQVTQHIIIVDHSSDYRELITNAVVKSVKSSVTKIYAYVFNVVADRQTIIDDAEFDHGITVTIQDINDIVEVVKNNAALNRYIAPDVKPTSNTVIDKKKKIIYDLFTTGAQVADLKKEFINSYILYALYEKEALTSNEIFNNVKESLPTLQLTAFDEAMQSVCSNGQVVYKNNKFCLTDEFRATMDHFSALTQSTEALLKQELEDCLSKYSIRGLSDMIFNKVTELYKSHYDCELDDFNAGDDWNKKEKQLYGELIDLILRQKKDNINATIARTIIKEILDIIGKSELINKTSLTTMFTSMFNSDQLEEYMDKQTRIVFLDTQILLQYLCLIYQDNTGYDDILYDSVAILKRQFRESRDYLRLFTTSGYIEEVVNHLWEAYSLRRFLSLDYIADLGPSKNVFFNFYRYLYDNENMGYEDFEDFIAELLEYDEHIPESYNNFKNAIYPCVSEIFDAAGINIINIDTPETFSTYQKTYDNVLTNKKIYNKSTAAKDKDVLCCYYLSDERNFINEETGLSELPFFVTMDSTMVELRKMLLERQHRNLYYVYPPLLFANRLSVMDLKLNSATINYNIICLTEHNFNASNDTLSMLDIISSILPNDKTKTVKDFLTPKKLAALKRKQQYDVDVEAFKRYNHDNLPIDCVLNEVSRHYRRSDINKLTLLTNLFMQNEYTERLVALLEEQCVVYDKNKKVDQTLYNEIDKMMAEMYNKSHKG